MLKYKVITSERQYISYCKALEALLFQGAKSKELKEEIALLTLLVKTWEEDHYSFENTDPVELLISLMQEHGINSTQLAEMLDVSKGLVSDMLNYKKYFSKKTIRLLSSYFKVKQEAFNRPYGLKLESKKQVKVSKAGV